MRKLKSIIDSFVEYSSTGTSPAIFRRWGALSMIGAAVEQKQWVVTMGEKTYPNLYVIFIAPPGVGKTLVTQKVRRFWKTLKDHYICASSVSGASMMDELRKAERIFIHPKVGPIKYHSLKICSNEMQVLIPTYDEIILGRMTDIYDGHDYGERRRSGKGENDFDLEFPQMNFLAATTPKYMTSVFPEGAWEMGFMSRCNTIFAGEQERRSLFSNVKEDAALFNAISHDLNYVSNQYGEMVFEPEAASLLDEWWMQGGPPAPEHPRMSTYNARRHFHLMKLMMISSIDRGESRIITGEDFELALSWLMEAEARIPDIFKSMAAQGEGKVLEDIHHELLIAYKKHGSKPIPEANLRRRIMKSMPSHAVDRALENMKMAKMITLEKVEGAGNCYKPLPITSGLHT